MKNCRTIIFSRNRSLQLHLLLSSLFRHCSDLLDTSDIYVLYRNNPEHEPSYATLMSEFPQVSFVKEENFKNDLLNLLPHKSEISWGKSGDFVMFLTDDSVFTTNFSMKKVISTLVENKDCLGFSLRLGKNTKHCYPYNCEQATPKTEKVSDNILKYSWTDAEYDFGYPLELSSSAFCLEDISDILNNCVYDSPNTLESIMSSCHLDKKNLLIFERSVAFSMPLNLVQGTHPNRNENFNPDTFRLMYEKGLRFDVKQFDNYISRGAHDVPKNIEVININE